MLYACVISHLFSDENLLSSKKKSKEKEKKLGRQEKTRTICNIQNDSTLERYLIDLLNVYIIDDIVK